MKKEYLHIKIYFKELDEDSKSEILYDLKQLKGLVLDQIEIPYMKQYLTNNIIMVLDFLDKLLQEKKLQVSELFKLQLLIKDDIIVIKENEDIIYGEKRTFGEYMNYIYNVLDFIINNEKE